MPPVEPIPQDILDAMDHMNDYVNSDRMQTEIANVSDQVDDNIRNCPGRNGNQNRNRNAPRGNDNDFQAQRMRPVWTMREVYNGMFAYVKYLGFWHAILVTGKTPERNVVTGVHFAWPTLFSRRVISEDEFAVDLSKDELWEVHVPENRRVAPDEAVARAREKIGGKGFNMFTRRSSHVIKECVLRM